MIGTFLKRRFWIIQSRFFVVMALVFGLPAFIFLFFHTQTHLNSNPQFFAPEWLVYLWFLMGTITLYINVNNDVNEYSIYNRKVFPLILSPVSPRKINFYLITSIVLETFIISCLSGSILWVISGIDFPTESLVIIIPVFLIFLFILGNIISLFSLITSDFFLYHFISFSFVLVCMVSPGINVLNSQSFGLVHIWNYLPTTMLINFISIFLITGIKKWLFFLCPFIVGLVIIMLNGELFSRNVQK